VPCPPRWPVAAAQGQRRLRRPQLAAAVDRGGRSKSWPIALPLGAAIDSVDPDRGRRGPAARGDAPGIHVIPIDADD
jgi:hypothetical protein